MEISEIAPKGWIFDFLRFPNNVWTALIMNWQNIFPIVYGGVAAARGKSETEPKGTPLLSHAIAAISRIRLMIS